MLSYAAYDPLLPRERPDARAGLLRFYMFSGRRTRRGFTGVEQGGAHPRWGSRCCQWCWPSSGRCCPAVRWPPVRSLAQILERVSLIMLVGGVLFEFATGILNTRTTTSSRSPCPPLRWRIYRVDDIGGQMDG